MRATPKILVRTSDLAEVVDAVTRVYCPHEIHARKSNLRLPATLEVIHAGVQPIVELRYATPVSIDAGNFPRLMLMQTCVEGTGTATQENVSVICRRGQTVPLSQGMSTQVEFDGRFAQRSVRLDIERMEALCGRWMNRPMERPLRFELRAFSDELEKAWAHAVALMLSYERMGLSLPAAAAKNLDEFLLSLLLAQHPHNYSDDLHERSRAAPPRLIREAEHWMRTGGPTVTVSAVASQLGVSLRSLEAGFRDWHGATPTQYLRRIRLGQVREELRAPTDSTTVTSAALEHGFFHLPRFSGYYRAAFGEGAGVTLRRSRERRGGF